MKEAFTRFAGFAILRVTSCAPIFIGRIKIISLKNSSDDFESSDECPQNSFTPLRWICNPLFGSPYNFRSIANAVELG